MSLTTARRPTSVTTTITTIRTIAIPASDPDRTTAWFLDRLGFEKRFDAELQPGFRWIEVAAPGSPVSVAIIRAGATASAGIDTGIRFLATDATAEHASMKGQGVDVSDLLDWPGVPLMFSFRDPDGNVFYLSEPDKPAG
jgi:catechol 2,3-dioxygenase-like lactoylglutathione lyase family enzyme